MGEREGRATSGGRRSHQDHQQQAELGGAPPPAPTSAAPSGGGGGDRRRAELTRTLSMVDVCAVCLDEVRERRQRVTRLPCSHKYHSECVLPWLAIHPDCPCCRALVPAAAAAAADVDLFCSGPPVTWHVARGSPALLEAAAILQVCN